MGQIGLCPNCGKLIAFDFPIHDCRPTANFLRALARKINARQKGNTMNHLVKFRDLKIGDRFIFTGSGFSHTCTKTSARTYTWVGGVNGETLKTKVGTINVKVVKK
jgi:hypothetical protein